MSKQPDWNGNIDTARESGKYGSPQETSDGNREYPNGTYGQKEYTVRSIGGGKSAVFIESDSDRLHAHYEIDKDGNIITKYHDFMMLNENVINFEQLFYVTEEDCLEAANEILQQSSKPKTLSKRMF